jgi:D-alanine-D-alanine ligase
MKSILGKKGLRWSLEKVSGRPPMKERRGNISLAKNLMATAQKWEIPLELESSLMPSAGGYAPAKIPVVCGIGPVARDLYAPQEAINRISLIQRTLLIAEFLAQDVKKTNRK